jgi:hypothetical protein
VFWFYQLTPVLDIGLLNLKLGILSDYLS